MTTPNMNLTLPAVGVTIGPTWASQLNSALEVVDAHTHLPGSGLPITSNAIEINDTLPFNGFALESVGYLGLVSRPASSALPATVYVVNGDLFYNNASGVPVQVTNGASIAGATGSISGLVAPASASFQAGLASFQWNANATTRATLDAAALQLRQAGGATAASITLAAPTSGVTAYTLRLPATAPATVSRFLFTSTSGDSVWVQPDNVTLEVSGTTLRVKDLGINVSRLAANAVETSKIADLQVTTGKIAIQAVTHSRLGQQAVQASNIHPQAVDEPAIAGGAVTESKILNLNVTTAKLADLAVTTEKLDNLAVTTGKIDNLAVTTAKIGDLQVTLNKLANESVSAAKIVPLTITSDEMAANSITTSKIVDGAVLTSKIGDNQVTPAKRVVRFGYGTFNAVSSIQISAYGGSYIFPGFNTQPVSLDTGRVATISIQPTGGGAVAELEVENRNGISSRSFNIVTRLKDNTGSVMRTWTSKITLNGNTVQSFPMLMFQDTVLLGRTDCYVELEINATGTDIWINNMGSMVWTINQ